MIQCNREKCTNLRSENSYLELPLIHLSFVASTNPHNPDLLKFTTPTPLPKTSISPYLRRIFNFHQQTPTLNMETRLFHARKTRATKSGHRSWVIVKPEKGGIPVTAHQSSKMDTACLCLAADVSEFLLEFMGKGGVLEGW